MKERQTHVIISVNEKYAHCPSCTYKMARTHMSHIVHEEEIVGSFLARMQRPALQASRKDHGTDQSSL